MAASESYQCDFIDSVLEDFYCKKCSLVARRLTVTSCCGESFCYACIADIQQQDKLCPECGHQSFALFELIKYQRRIASLRVYCSMRRRGCDWSGTLEQLDAHLDPDQDNCLHVDIECPLNCQQNIPKNKVEQHVAKECVRRDYFCKHCGFKATFEEVVDTHLAECTYFPLQCPNMCGVTCERDIMKDHMSICRLEEVVCEFSSMGCDGRFRREDQEEHAMQNSHKHLVLKAAAPFFLKKNQQLQRTLQEQDKKLQQYEQNSKEQDQKLQEYEQKCVEQDQKLQEYKQLSKEQQQKFKLQEQKVQMQLQEQHLLESRIAQLQKDCEENETVVTAAKPFIRKYSFKMNNFSMVKAKDGDWKSPAMRLRPEKYPFSIGVHATKRNEAISVDLWANHGNMDQKSIWPAQATFTIELVNYQRGDNWRVTKTVNWSCPSQINTDVRPTYAPTQLIKTGVRTTYVQTLSLIPSSNVYLNEDSLHFNVTVICFM